MSLDKVGLYSKGNPLGLYYYINRLSVALCTGEGPIDDVLFGEGYHVGVASDGLNRGWVYNGGFYRPQSSDPPTPTPRRQRQRRCRLRASCQLPLAKTTTHFEVLIISYGSQLTSLISKCSQEIILN